MHHLAGRNQEWCTAGGRRGKCLETRACDVEARRLPGLGRALDRLPLLSRLRRGNHLLGVLAVRGRQHDGVDVLVGEEGVEVLRQGQRLRLGKRRDVGDTVRVAPATKRIDVAVDLDGFDDGAPPPPHSDDCGPDQFARSPAGLNNKTRSTLSLPVLYAFCRINENFGSAPRLSATGSPSSFRTMLVPWTSDTIL